MMIFVKTSDCCCTLSSPNLSLKVCNFRFCNFKSTALGKTPFIMIGMIPILGFYDRSEVETKTKINMKNKKAASSHFQS